MRTTPPQRPHSLWTRIGAWIEALEPPSPSDESERLRQRVDALEHELALLRTQHQDAAKA